MPQRAVVIEVDPKNGEFVYKPAVLRLNVGDSVVWEFALGNFALFFPRSPFDEVHFQGTAKKRAESSSVRDDATPGTYPYVVAVHTGERVWIDASCPEVVIKRGG